MLLSNPEKHWRLEGVISYFLDFSPCFKHVFTSAKLEALIAFPFFFVIVSCHWLVVVIVSYISLFRKPARKHATQLYIVLQAQQDRAIHKLVTGIK